MQWHFAATRKNNYFYNPSDAKFLLPSESNIHSLFFKSGSYTRWKSLKPFHTPIMLRHPGPFGKFIRTQQKKYTHPTVSQEKSEQDSIPSHRDRITDQSKPAVPSLSGRHLLSALYDQPPIT